MDKEQRCNARTKYWHRMVPLYLRFTEYSRNKSEVFLQVLFDIIGKVRHCSAYLT